METLEFDLFDFDEAVETLTLENLPAPTPITLPVPTLIPIPDLPRSNYRIAPEDILFPTGTKHKISANFEAIRLLKELEQSGRSASNDECKILIRYSGWGGIPQVFDAERTEFAKEYAELKTLLTNEEYVSARASTLNSHYTPKFLIEFMRPRRGQ